MKKYTIDYFIKKFKAIPEDKWTTHTFKNGKGQCCALGHCGQDFNCDTEESETLTGIFRNNLGMPVAYVNDTNFFQSASTPKARILNALRKMQRKGKRK